MPDTREQEIERLSKELHAIYQKEARRQAKTGEDTVRHPNDYDALPEHTKEYDRVLARYILSLLDYYRELCNSKDDLSAASEKRLLSELMEVRAAGKRIMAERDTTRTELAQVRQQRSDDKAWCSEAMKEMAIRKRLEQELVEAKVLIANACVCANRYPDHPDPEYSRLLCPIHQDRTATNVSGDTALDPPK